MKWVRKRVKMVPQSDREREKSRVNAKKIK